MMASAIVVASTASSAGTWATARSGRLSHLRFDDPSDVRRPILCGRTPWPLAVARTRPILCTAADAGGDEQLASQFASEVLRRQQERADDDGERQQEEGARDGSDDRELFAGVREIVLDGKGLPQAIPRRPAPPPGTEMEGELRQLVLNPQFLLGCIFTVGSLALFLAIASADQAAS